MRSAAAALLTGRLSSLREHSLLFQDMPFRQRGCIFRQTLVSRITFNASDWLEYPGQPVEAEDRLTQEQLERLQILR